MSTSIGRGRRGETLVKVAVPSLQQQILETAGPPKREKNMQGEKRAPK